MVLLADVEGCNARAELVGRSQDQRQIDVRRFGRSQILTDLEDLNMTDHLINSPETKLGHDGAELVSNVIKEVDYVLRGAGKLLAELRILSGNTDRAGIQLSKR